MNAKGKGGATPLHEAVWRDQREVAALLLANNADPNAKNNDGETPLHWAVKNGQRESAELLLANQADPNERNNAGQTPLDQAKSQAQTTPTAGRGHDPAGLCAGRPAAVACPRATEPKPEADGRPVAPARRAG